MKSALANERLSTQHQNQKIMQLRVVATKRTVWQELNTPGQTPFGAWLDPVVDKYGTIIPHLVLLYVVLYGELPYWTSMILISASIDMCSQLFVRKLIGATAAKSPPSWYGKVKTWTESLFNVAIGLYLVLQYAVCLYAAGVLLIASTVLAYKSVALHVRCGVAAIEALKQGNASTGVQLRSVN